MTDVRALIFDLYGTLLEVRAVKAAVSEVTKDSTALVSLWRQKQLEYSWLRALMGRYEDFWAVTADALDYAIEQRGLRLGQATRSQLLDAWLTVRPYPEVATALERLASRSLVVQSNGSPRMLEAALRSAGLRDRFVHVLSVDEVRTYKPAPAVYALAESRLRLAREHLLFVSSNAWDAAGAKAFGLPTAWVNRLGVAEERLGVTPDIVVRDLIDLVERVTS